MISTPLKCQNEQILSICKEHSSNPVMPLPSCCCALLAERQLADFGCGKEKDNTFKTTASTLQAASLLSIQLQTG